MFQNILDKLAEIEKQKAELMKQVRETSLGDVFGFLFEKHQNLEAFRFTAYTPYFCDGDPCYYRVNSDADLLLKDRSDEDRQINDGWLNEDAFYGKFGGGNSSSPEAIAAGNINKEISSCLRKIPKDIMEGLFGDHVEVTIRFKDGKVVSELEEYQHE